MTWTKREPVTNLVVLGDDEGNIAKIGGLLVATPIDRMYEKKLNYEILKKSGEVVTLSGSASLSRQLNDRDIGKFVRCEFKGWGKSPNGKFKDIEVMIWEGEPTDDMKRDWPRYAEFAKQNGNGKKADTPKAKADDDFDDDEAVKKLADEDDDLPF